MNYKDIIEKEINNNNWEIVETNDQHKQYKFYKKELTTVYCQFSVLNKGCTIFEFLKDVESLKVGNDIFFFVFFDIYFFVLNFWLFGEIKKRDK